MGKIATGKQKRSMRKIAYIQRFGLRHTEGRDRDLTPAFLSQLSFCKTDECRRIILGVSR